MISDPAETVVAPVGRVQDDGLAARCVDLRREGAQDVDGVPARFQPRHELADVLLGAAVAEIRPVSVDEEDAHQAVSAWSTSGHPASRSEITRRSTAGQSMASLGSSQRRPRAASGA